MRANVHVDRPRRADASQRSGGLRSSTALAATSSPKDSSRIGVDLGKQLGEVGSRGQRLVGVPAKVAVLTVKAPFSLRAHVREFRDDHFLPVVWRPKSLPFLVQDHRAAYDSVTNSHLRPDGGRNPLRAVCRQLFVDLCLLLLGQCQSCSPIETTSDCRTSVSASAEGRRLNAIVRRLRRGESNPQHGAETRWVAH